MKEQPSANRKEWIALVQTEVSGFCEEQMTPPPPKKKKKKHRKPAYIGMREFNLFRSVIHCTEGNSTT